MPPRSLAAFLKAARSALTAPASQRTKPLTLVVGNESADLDSLCSAVLLAYFRSHTPPHNVSLHIPLSNLPRADLSLRPELGAALSGSASDSCSGVPLDSLITLSELPSDLVAADTRWLLVDHNALTGDLAKRFAASVVGCIDHHVDEGTVPPPDDTLGNGPRVIEKCGSCASLVVDYARDAWIQLAQQAPDMATDRVLARLALAPILVDTSNLKSPSKTVGVDRLAVALAESVLGTKSTESLEKEGSSSFPYEKDTGYDRTAYFDELSRLKDDISQFTYNDILRKDYKQWSETTSSSGDAGRQLTLGMSTVVQGMGYLLDHIGDQETLFSELRQFARKRNLDIAAIMTIQHDGGRFARQLLLWAFTEQAAKAVQLFVKNNKDTLGLATWEEGRLDSTAEEGGHGGEWRACWTQGSTEFSRKQLAPYLRVAMRSS